MKSNRSAKKKSIIPLLLLILPTVLLGGYVYLTSHGVISGVDFFDISGIFGMVFGTLCFYILPVIFVVMLISRLVHNSKSDYSSDNYTTMPHDDFLHQGGIDNGTNSEKAENEVYRESCNELILEEAQRLSDCHEADKYCEKLTFAEVCTELEHFAKSKGVMFSAELVRSIISAIATSKYICVVDKAENRAMTLNALGIISEYFGNGLHPSTVGKNGLEQAAPSVCLDAINQSTASGFLKDVYFSNYTSGVCFAAIDGIDLGEDIGEFGDITYLSSLNGMDSNLVLTRIKTNKLRYIEAGEKLHITDAVHYFVILKEGMDISRLPEHAVLLDMSSVEGCEPSFIGCNIRRPSSAVFDLLVRNAREAYPISDYMWGRIDTFELYLHEKVGFLLSNIKVRALEKYYAVYCACGAEGDMSLDQALCACLQSTLNGYSAMFVKDTGESVFEAINRIFGHDRLPLCVEYTKRLSGL